MFTSAISRAYQIGMPSSTYPLNTAQKLRLGFAERLYPCRHDIHYNFCEQSRHLVSIFPSLGRHIGAGYEPPITTRNTMKHRNLEICRKCTTNSSTRLQDGRAFLGWRRPGVRLRGLLSSVPSCRRSSRLSPPLSAPHPPEAGKLGEQEQAQELCSSMTFRRVLFKLGQHPCLS